MKPGLFRSWSEAVLTLAAAIGLGAVLWGLAVVVIIAFS